MAKLALNQRSLHAESKRLAAFQRFLPAVDLKRRQLLAERNAAQRRLQRLQADFTALAERVGAELPMLADPAQDLGGLVRLRAVEVGEENLMGTRLPALRAVDIEPVPYGVLATPAWLDLAQAVLARAMVLEVERRLAVERLARLEVAVRKGTQRYNLFDKVLIPRTRANIRRIGLFLADQSRAAVVRAKLAKRRRPDGDR